MNKLFCRSFQAVMKLGNYFMGYRLPEYLSGPGSIQKLPEFMLKKGAKKALVVTDKGLMGLGLPNGMLKALEENNIEYVLFSEVKPNPTSRDVEAGYKLYAENNCQCIVAFGGGSPMDCAKGIAAKSAHPNKSVAQLQGLLKVHKRIPLFFAVPTTAGTGSETTVAAVITDDKTHRKASINDPSILPKYAVLDPELTIGLPPFVTAMTGMDALCHAVEAYTNYTYTTPLERQLSKDAVKLVYENLLTVYKDGKNVEARQNMLMASFYAGRAFTRGCVGYVHAIGHTLGGLYNIPHGLAIALCFSPVLRAYLPFAESKLSELALFCGLGSIDNSDAENADIFISNIDSLIKKLGISSEKISFNADNIDDIVLRAQEEAKIIGYPRPFSDEELKNIILSIFR